MNILITLVYSTDSIDTLPVTTIHFCNHIQISNSGLAAFSVSELQRIISSAAAQVLPSTISAASTSSSARDSLLTPVQPAAQTTTADEAAEFDDAIALAESQLSASILADVPESFSSILDEIEMAVGGEAQPAAEEESPTLMPFAQ